MKMTVEAEKAVCTLQNRVSKTADLKAQERDERAIDEIIRHPENTLPESFQRKNAVRHAQWDMTRRAKKTSSTSLDDPGQFETAIERIIAHEDAGFGLGEIMLWLATSSGLREADRAILMALADGYDAELLALMKGIPVKRMRERISRARSRGWAVYAAEVPAA